MRNVEPEIAFGQIEKKLPPKGITLSEAVTSQLGKADLQDKNFDTPSIQQQSLPGEIEKTLLKREGSPVDVAKAVLFLLEGADFTTGTCIFVDGGKLLF